MELAKNYWDAMRVASAHVLVIDNGSDPPLPNAYRLHENTGFCHANNVGLRVATTEAVLFVNNDVYHVADDWLALIVKAMEPGVLVGATMRYDQHANVDGRSMPYLDGWCIGGMRDDLIAIGGWNETLEEPAYYSDNLLCLAARMNGMRLREVRTGLRHIENATAGPSNNPRVEYATRINRATYERKARATLAAAA